MKPFLKWAGNKYQIIERIKSELPHGSRLIEPFVGSGAVFLNTDYSQYLLSDVNPDLIELYLYLQKDGENFIDYCRYYFQPQFNDRIAYQEFRALFNSTDDSRLKSALFIYLNKHSFNGLCRYNSRGNFNAPFGQHKKPYFPEKEMYFFHQKAQSAVFKVMDFQRIMVSARAGDVIYCDPPYVPLSLTSNFTKYHMDGFTMPQQQELVVLAEILAKQGIKVVISNHATEYTQTLYRNAKLQTFPVQRYISRDGTKRKKALEVLAVYV